MNGAIDRRELTYKSLAGLIGGAIGWLPVELVVHGHSLTQAVTVTEAIGNFAASAIVAGLIGGFILASDEKTLEFSAQIRRKFLRGFIVCFFLSLPATYLANLIFAVVLGAGGWGVGRAGSYFFLVLGRVLGWGVDGLMLGLGVGLASLSFKNVLRGAAGGWVGGFVGGLFFDMVGAISNSGLISRFIGEAAIGLAIGFFIGLAYELTKNAWVSVEAGRLKGRQFRIDGSSATIGRAEESVIGLFGDPGVQSRHAIIERRRDNYWLRNLAVQEGTFVNDKRVETVELREGDRIKISNYDLSFHLRQGERVSPPVHPTFEPARESAARVDADGRIRAVVTNHVDGSVGAGTPYLQTADGEQLPVRVGTTTTLGRAVDNDIVVADASVSRHHATIVPSVGGAYRLRDLGSQNGTYVRGERISDVQLANGDSVKLGEAAFVFHA